MGWIVLLVMGVIVLLVIGVPVGLLVWSRRRGNHGVEGDPQANRDLGAQGRSSYDSSAGPSYGAGGQV